MCVNKTSKTWIPHAEKPLELTHGLSLLVYPSDTQLRKRFTFKTSNHTKRKTGYLCLCPFVPLGPEKTCTINKQIDTHAVGINIKPKSVHEDYCTSLHTNGSMIPTRGIYFCIAFDCTFLNFSGSMKPKTSVSKRLLVMSSLTFGQGRCKNNHNFRNNRVWTDFFDIFHKSHKQKNCHRNPSMAVFSSHIESYHLLILPGYTLKASSRHLMAAFRSSMQMQ